MVLAGSVSLDDLTGAMGGDTDYIEVAEQYVTSRMRTLKASSVRSYTDILECYLLKISQITEDRIKKFQDRLSDGRSAARVNNVMILLRSIFKKCLRGGLIADNPCVNVPCLREEPAEIDPLTLEELDLALSKIHPFYKPLFQVLAWSGMRPAEARALRWGDIDWRRNEIKIAKGRARGTELIDGGRKTKYVESTPKTKSSNRIIPMHPEVRKALDELDKRPLKNANGYIFITKNGQPLDMPLDNIWSRALTKSGIRHRRSYQLRHTWASMALEAGESPDWVASMLGHETMATTLNTMLDSFRTSKTELSLDRSGHLG